MRAVLGPELRGQPAQPRRGGLDRRLRSGREPASDQEATGAARAAIDRGLDPACAEAAEIVERFVLAYAAAMGRPPDRAFRDWLVAQYRDRDPRMVRYGELLAVLRGEPALAHPSEEWSWLIAASRAHLEQ